MHQRLWMALSAAVIALALGGCAHPVTMRPETGALNAPSTVPKIDRTAALLVTPAQQALVVTSPGGGGDKITYKPYQELETGLYIALDQVFERTVLARSLEDPQLAREANLLVITPTISTTSYSPSPFTWPPTLFTITLDVAIHNGARQPVTRLQVQGEGRAEFDEFKRDFSLAPNRAAQNVLQRLIESLREQADLLRR